MEKICQHIEKLLAQHDYVVVPNLGGFVVQMQSAILMADRITPPQATIGFNPLMHHADGLLAIEIARTEGLSYRLSVELIEKEVDYIKTQLHNTGNTQIGNLGFLQQNKTGNLYFTPTKNAEFLPQNFELCDLHISPRAIQSTKKRKAITLSLPSTHIYKYAAAGMLIFGLMFTSPKLNDMRQTNQADLTSLACISTAKITPPIATLALVEKKVSKEKVTEQIKEELPNNYHVIVASLSTQTASEEFCKTLSREKFTEAHTLSSTNIYRVAIQSFSDKKEALQYMEKLRNTDSRFETAWVLCN